MYNLHVAIIMDGNGRWAQRRGLPRTAGHVEGAKAVNEVVEAAARTGLRALTLYAFSADNWGRPNTEVAALMRLLRRYLMTETGRCIEQSIRINIIGRRDRLSAALVHAIEQSERLTAACTGMHLRIAVDYSAAPAGAVDLLIRTGAEKRLSDFLLWQCAYAELFFADCMWPDFGESGL